VTSWTVVDSPVDPLLLAAGEDGLSAVWFSPHKGVEQAARTAADGWRRDDQHPVLVAAREQLGEYFAGTRREFDLPLAPRGTGFQQRVWLRLREIPYGQTRSYGEVAAQLGLDPGAARAVGLANGANPLSIVVPCHRVVGADGSLTGFGGGLARKRHLLDLESDLLF
jgi:methylated-DNA-[protein]-cysteine S-methyltransferase